MRKETAPDSKHQTPNFHFFPYICAAQLVLLPQAANEKGSRCKSGAIPVAVTFASAERRVMKIAPFFTQTVIPRHFGNRHGKAITAERSQKTCQLSFHHSCFRRKSREENAAELSISIYFSIAVTQKF
jgi:hypothetical protein